MPDDFIKIDVQGEEKIVAAIKQYPRKVARYMGQAGKEAITKGVFYEVGLKKYPPETDANKPPTPYYIRGRGMQYKSRNDQKSERLGTQWYIANRNGGFITEVGNRASYADYVVGEGQAYALGRKGWKKLVPTVYKNYQRILFIYEEWIKRLLNDIDLFGGA